MGTLIHFPVRPAPDRGLPRTSTESSRPGTSTTARRIAAPDPAEPGSTETARTSGPSLLWREAVGHELRAERTAQARTLADVARRAGVSTQYLSEIERGRKEPSSEVLEAVGAALSLTLLDLTTRVSGALSRTTGTSPSLMAS